MVAKLQTTQDFLEQSLPWLMVLQEYKSQLAGYQILI